MWQVEGGSTAHCMNDERIPMQAPSEKLSQTSLGIQYSFKSNSKKSNEDSVCGVMFEIERLYKIPHGLQTLILGDIQLNSSKVLYYYDISNENNNTLTLIIKQHDTFTSEYLMIMKEQADDYTKKNNGYFNIAEFQNLVLQKAIEQGIDPLIRNK